MNNDKIDNALIHQKDKIYKEIWEQEYETALDLLDFVRELWFACGYGYKYSELRLIIVNELRNWISIRNHWKQVEKYQRLLERANGLAA